ncbi:hypothetical protein [Bacillus cereus group sp. N21]|uniref:hypothetical protein n=1 Tax=Bacillus cereus group sp. N21 TaxID=2794591 RepID=UPI0018F67299|nr:hypothetical protein [Bacillus cereus group sp. N21]MBJ8031978.1 hypothetical protein [Bacillus cereus group sp. N21]
MTWMSFFIGYSVGMMLTVLIMKSLIEAKVANELDDIDKSVLNEMEQLRAIMDDKI